MEIEYEMFYFANFLKERRKVMGITQYELAKISSCIKICNSKMGNRERNSGQNKSEAIS